jgi:hypothetical protein
MRVVRARWKIENETFNTLKNRGCHFEHNFGHGKQYLCGTLAGLMLLAFLIDQILRTCLSLLSTGSGALQIASVSMGAVPSTVPDLPCSRPGGADERLGLTFPDPPDGPALTGHPLAESLRRRTP